MRILDFFRPVPSMSAEEIREIMKKESSDRYMLVDVRQPKEYEQRHIPGARLVPLGELSSRLNELDPV